MRRLTLLLLALAATQAGADPNMPGTDRITYFGYEDCILLENTHTRVVLTSSAGRVLEYSRKGPNAIYLDPAQEGATFEDGDPRFGPTGGRLDIGPEMIIPAHPDLWLGQWESQITGPRSARLISKEDEPTGVQLIRDFQLAEDSTHLSVTQTIKNVSDSAKHWGHWSPHLWHRRRHRAHSPDAEPLPGFLCHVRPRPGHQLPPRRPQHPHPRQLPRSPLHAAQSQARHGLASRVVRLSRPQRPAVGQTLSSVPRSSPMANWPG